MDMIAFVADAFEIPLRFSIIRVQDPCLRVCEKQQLPIGLLPEVLIKRWGSVQGLAALLVQGLGGCRPGDVAAVDPAAIIDGLGLKQKLTPSRNNGFVNMFRLMQQKAAQLDGASGSGVQVLFPRCLFPGRKQHVVYVRPHMQAATPRPPQISKPRASSIV